VPPVPQIDRAEIDPERCVRDNQAGPATLATVLSQSDIPFLTFSSAQVYDGRQFTPYGESAPPAPLNAYGRIQARTDALVARTHGKSLIVRTSDRFGILPQDWMGVALEALRGGGGFTAAADVLESLTFIPDLVDASLDLLIDRATGLWHVANRGCSSRAALIAHAADLLGLDTARLDRQGARSVHVQAPRAAYLALHSERGVALPTLASAAERYVETHRARFAITGNGRRRRSA
ncbi:MAG: sugar nucleotide-binding protein, partial [Pseudomonadota bacterium]|nr:sugar nucleotide-binding protein [Pseudomonadota bacterium]